MATRLSRSARGAQCPVVSRPASRQSPPALLTLSRTASLVGGLLWACLAVSAMWLVGVASLLLLLLGLAQLWLLGRDRLGRFGQAGIVVSALALAAMALGNGIELYAVTARGTDSEIGHTIFLI